MSTSHHKWLWFLFFTLFLLWGSGYTQREIRTFKQVSQPDFFDFKVYYTAGLLVRQNGNESLYSYKQIPDPNDASNQVVVNPQQQPPEPKSPFGILALQTGAEGQYVYPPFMAWVIAPITFFSIEKAIIIWHLLVFVLAGGAIILTLKIFYDDVLKILIIGGILLAVCEFTAPMQSLLYGLNVSSLILFFCAAGVYFHKKYPVAGACFFALAVIIKLTPIIVVPLIILRKQWRWSIAFAGWSALFWGLSIWRLGYENHYEFFLKVMPAMSGILPHIDNRSFVTLIYAITYGNFLSSQEIIQNNYVNTGQFPTIIFRVFAVLSYVTLLLYFKFKNKTDSCIYEEIFILLVWSLVFSPVSLRYSYVLAIAPVIFAWCHPATKIASTLNLSIFSVGVLLVFSTIPNYLLVVSDNFWIEMSVFSTFLLGVCFLIWHLLYLIENSSCREYPNGKNRNEGKTA